MTIVPLLFIVVGAGTVSVILDRRYRANRLASAHAADTSNTSGQGASGIEQLWSTPMAWYRSLMNKQAEDFPESFRTWATESLDDPTVKDWINALSPEGLKAYTKHLSGFCTDMGFQLVWLVDKSSGYQDPHLLQRLQQIVLNYCQACQQAATNQDALDVHKQILSLKQNPGGRKNRAFSEKLLAKLVGANMVTLSMSDFLAASPQERQQLIIDAINEASSKDQSAFTQLVRQVMFEDDVDTTAADNSSAPTASGTQPSNSA